MKTFQVTLPDEFVAVVDRLMATGEWDSVDRLFMYGLLRAADDKPDGSESTAQAVQLGIEQADRGEVVDGPAMFDRLRSKLSQVRKQPA